MTLAAVVVLERALYRGAYRSAPAAADPGSVTRAGRTAPGPRTHWPTGHLLAFRRDPLTLFTAARDRHGDVVRFRLGTMPVHLVAHPDDVQYVLVTNQRNYDKDTRSSAQIRSVIGESLLTSNGDAWLAKRRAMQPAFKPQSVATFASAIVEATDAMLRRWESHAAAGRPIDVASEMMGVTYTIVGKSLFGTDVSAEVEAAADAATRVMAHAYRRVEWFLNVPGWLPTPDNLAFRRATAQLDALVYGIIDDRQLRSGNDLVSLLLRPDKGTRR